MWYQICRFLLKISLSDGIAGNRFKSNDGIPKNLDKGGNEAGWVLVIQNDIF